MFMDKTKFDELNLNLFKYYWANKKHTFYPVKFEFV
jgi:hypothetical protein